MGETGPLLGISWLIQVEPVSQPTEDQAARLGSLAGEDWDFQGSLLFRLLSDSASFLPFSRPA